MMLDSIRLFAELDIPFTDCSEAVKVTVTDVFPHPEIPRSSVKFALFVE
jgi:hypothetical protein